MDVMSFAKAIKQASNDGTPHLLLGNGFSRAYDDNIFSYSMLLEQAKFENVSANARKAFDVLKTTDFEVVMRTLRDAAKLSKLYVQDPTATGQMEEDARGLRELLAQTIADHHPGRPTDIPEACYQSCRHFLSQFGSIYTLNYDLLLYWAVMHTERGPEISADDGFRQPDRGKEEYVTWDITNAFRQNVFYFHGALHIFDADTEIRKFTWSNTGIALIDQIRSALDGDMFPLIVAEGTSPQKMSHILHSAYLSRAQRSFVQLAGSLFIYGMSMNDSDDHVLDLIRRGKVSIAYVGLHGDPTTAGNKRIIGKMKAVVNARSDRRPLQVLFYDVASAHVWR